MHLCSCTDAARYGGRAQAILANPVRGLQGGVREERAAFVRVELERPYVAIPTCTRKFVDFY